MKNILFIRGKGRYEQIDVSSIMYAEIDNQYISIVTKERTYRTLATMKQLEKYLPGDQFCKVHRAFIVGIRYIQGFDSEKVYLESKEIPLAYKSREQLISSVNILTREMPARSTKCKTVRQIQQSRQKKVLQ